MRRSGVFVSMDMGSSMIKAALVHVGREGPRFLSTGFAPLYRFGATDADALEEAMSLDVRRTGAASVIGGAGAEAPLAVSSSMHGPLKVLVLGWKRAVAERMAARAISGSGGVISCSIWADSCQRDRRGERVEERILRDPPDCVLCVGAASARGDFNPGWFVGFVEMAPSAPVLYCGELGGLGFLEGSFGRGRVRRLLNEGVPGDDGDALMFGDILSELHTRRSREALASYSGRFPGPERSNRVTRFVSVNAAVDCALQSLVEHGLDRAIYVDVGSSATIMGERSPSGSRLTVAGGVGTGHGITGALERIPEERRDARLLDWAANRRSRPWIIPESPYELESERLILEACLDGVADLHGTGVRVPHAAKGMLVLAGVLGRSIIRWAGAEGSERVLSARGGLADNISILDRVKPPGAVRLAVDPANSLMHLGALRACFGAGAAPGADIPCLVSLGTLLTPVEEGGGGPGIRGGACLGIEMERAGSISVERGAVAGISLPAGETAIARVSPASGVDVGEGAGRPADIAVVGGILGFVVDARGISNDT